jgi:UTP--glucose-1-phosphate uridylyltransferase
MRAEKLPETVIENFRRYYQKLVKGETGLIPEEQIAPVESLTDAATLPQEMRDFGREEMGKAVVIKLNGGLGTSMGLEKAKSLLKVKEGFSFLDIIARQAMRSQVPVVFMNSFATRRDTLRELKAYPALDGDLPLDFLQHRVPKIDQNDLSPVVWPENPELEWCPPGHGDIYIALFTSGLADQFLQKDFAYAFVSNADNVGAVMDPSILGYFADKRLPFMMEVADRTEADNKGGHLARWKKGGYVLREIAQCPEEDVPAFQDIDRHRFFNTNNLWIHLPSLRQIMQKRNHILGLPMIRNRKTVDPRAPHSKPVFQLETAMGSAISVFEGAGAIRVPRARFAPVKNTNDLLAVRSDCYVLSDEFQILPNPKRTLGVVRIDLDPRYYKLIDHFESRFPHDVPSLIWCEALTVRGKFTFGPNVTVQGRVRLYEESERERLIEAGSRLQGPVDSREKA